MHDTALTIVDELAGWQVLGTWPGIDALPDGATIEVRMSGGYLITDHPDLDGTFLEVSGGVARKVDLPEPVTPEAIAAWRAQGSGGA